jgi:hypothetical protein
VIPDGYRELGPHEHRLVQLQGRKLLVQLFDPREETGKRSFWLRREKDAWSNGVSIALGLIGLFAGTSRPLPGEERDRRIRRLFRENAELTVKNQLLTEKLTQALERLEVAYKREVL